MPNITGEDQDMDKGMMPQERGGEPDGSDEAFPGLGFGAAMMSGMFSEASRDSALERQRREVIATFSNAAENISIATAILARMAQDALFAE